MGGVVPADFDIVLAARSMIRIYGRDAAAEARRRAGLEDVDSNTWRRILATIENLQAEKPAPGKTVQ